MIALLSVGCNAILGIDDHDVAASDSGNDSGPTGRDGSIPPGSDSGVDSGPPTGDGSVSPDAGPFVCVEGSSRCNGNTPQTCSDAGWVASASCGGASPVCSNGVCGSFAVTGSVSSLAPSTVANDAGFRIVSAGFEQGARACNDAGICVTGGIGP